MMKCYSATMVYLVGGVTHSCLVKMMIFNNIFDAIKEIKGNTFEETDLISITVTEIREEE